MLLIIALLTRREVLEKGFVFRSIPGLVLFLIGTTPFLYLYLPVLLDKEGHGFSTVLNNALYPVEFIRVGGSNLIWGWLEEEFFSAEYPAYSGGFSYIPNYERIAGFSPFLAMMFFISSFFFWCSNGLSLSARNNRTNDRKWFMKNHLVIVSHCEK